MTPEEEKAFEFEFDIEYELSNSKSAMTKADELKLQYPGKEKIIENCLFNLVKESALDLIPESPQVSQELSEASKRILSKIMDRVKILKEKGMNKNEHPE